MNTLFRRLKQSARHIARIRSADWMGGGYVSAASPPIIGGSGRSGTTLLRVMLDSHRNICCGPESWLFFRPTIDRAGLASRFDLDPGFIDTLYRDNSSRAEFIDRFFAAYAAAAGKPRWAEKSPRNIEALDFIFRAFPRARFVHMIRDGRDVACSWRTMPRFKVVDGELVPLNTWKPIRPAVERWKAALAIGRQYEQDPRYLEIRYEDLVLDTRRTLGRVLHFLGEPWDDKVLEHHTVDAPSRDAAKFPNNPEANAPVRDSAIGRWKHDLSEEDKQIFKDIAGAALIEKRYERSMDW